MLEFVQEDVDKARELLSRGGRPLPGDAAVQLVAMALNAERRSHTADPVTAGDLRI